MPAILKNSVKYTGNGGGQPVTAEAVICADGESVQYKLDNSLVTKETTGILDDLATDDKTDLVSAVNEIKNESSGFVKGKGIELNIVDGILQITYDTGETS